MAKETLNGLRVDHQPLDPEGFTFNNNKGNTTFFVWELEKESSYFLFLDSLKQA